VRALGLARGRAGSDGFLRHSGAAAAGGGDAMQSHADGLAPLVVARLGDGDAAVREAARRFLVVLMEAAHGDVSSNIYSYQAVPPLHHCHLPTTSMIIRLWCFYRKIQ